MNNFISICPRHVLVTLLTRQSNNSYIRRNLYISDINNYINLNSNTYIYIYINRERENIQTKIHAYIFISTYILKVRKINKIRNLTYLT